MRWLIALIRSNFHPCPARLVDLGRELSWVPEDLAFSFRGFLGSARVGPRRQGQTRSMPALRAKCFSGADGGGAVPVSRRR